MVSTISVGDLKKKLKDIFCNENKASNKYALVWLSEVDFGGLYYADKFVVNVKAEHEIPSCNEEIKYIAAVLFRQLSKEERLQIWRVNVYNSFEEIRCERDDILVYTMSDVCSS